LKTGTGSGKKEEMLKIQGDNPMIAYKNGVAALELS
jgi:hypothetical protein